MSEQKHTPEPWELHYEPIEVEGLMYGIGGGGSTTKSGNNFFVAGVCQLGNPGTPDALEGRANAIRIIECVNACADMADPEKEINRLNDERLRAELLLNECRGYIVEYLNLLEAQGWTRHQAADIADAKAILAKLGLHD